MIQYKKVLITADGSDKTGPATYYGLGMAKIMDAEVTVMSVIDESDYEDLMNAAIPEDQSVLYQKSPDAVNSSVDLE